VPIPLYRIHRTGFIALIIPSIVAMVSVWSRHLHIYNPTGLDVSHLDAVLSATVEATSTVAGLALALIFLTAQLSAVM
jgi:hypothetical protein